MADIVIRGMEMPTNCGECVFLRKLEKATPYISQFWCCINGLKVIKQEKNRYCPLVPLPEGHGRLIDADALKHELMVSGIILHYGTQINLKIDNAHTIVPAEGGPDNGD